MHTLVHKSQTWQRPLEDHGVLSSLDLWLQQGTQLWCEWSLIKRKRLWSARVPQRLCRALPVNKKVPAVPMEKSTGSSENFEEQGSRESSQPALRRWPWTPNSEAEGAAGRALGKGVSGSPSCGKRPTTWTAGPTNHALQWEHPTPHSALLRRS